MKKLVGMFMGAGLVALQGCAAGGAGFEEDVGFQEHELGASSLTFTYSTATAYCAKVTIQNALTQSTPRWQVVIDLKSTNVTSISGGKFSAVNAGKVTASPVDFNTSIAPNATATFNFCGSSTSATQRPVIAAWNMESNAYATCLSNSGVRPTLAALAVSAGRELGRWEPLTDFAKSSNRIVLSTTGLAKCGSNCGNTKALLGQQDAGFMPQNEFNAAMFRTEVNASFDRQYNKFEDLKRNQPGNLPPAHKLTLVAGPTNLGIGACGPHYVFQADKLDGTPLTSTQAANLGNALCFNGYGSCGNNNPYVNFVTNTSQCPTGRTCVAVDPTDGDVSSTNTTSAGTAPTYPMNRVWNPENTMLNSACIRTTGELTALKSKCSTSPSTCGYLYCIL